MSSVTKKRDVMTFLAMCMAAVAFGDVPSGKLRIDRTKFLIGAYCTQGFSPTEAQVGQMVEGGLDYVFGAFNGAALDACARKGLKVFQDGLVPWWWGGSELVTNGMMAAMRPIKGYEDAMRNMKDHPAIAAVAIADEPSALDFEHMGKAVETVERMSPCGFVYLNLFPSYASAASLTLEQARSQLGTATYEEHIERYCKYIPLDYICFDSYIWGWGNKPWVLYENLRVVGDACTGTGKSLWIVLQENTYEENGKRNGSGPMTLGRLRFQSNVAMAFGAEMISWACWRGWWEDCIIGKDGTTCAVMFDRIKQVNGEIHSLGDRLMAFRRTKTDFVDFGDTPDELHNVMQIAVPSSSGVAFANVKAADSSPLLVGHFLARDGSNGHAIYVVSCDDPHDRGGRSHRVSFAARGRKLSAFDRTGKIVLDETPDGLHSFTLRSNDAVLVVATR